MPLREQAISIDTFPIVETVEQQLERSVREHLRTVYRIAFSVLRNHHDSEDATQEVFMRFLRARRRAVTIRDERAWLARTAWRVALSSRRRMPQSSLDEAAAPVLRLRDSGASADEIAYRNEMRVLLEMLIAALPRELRESLLLSTVEELHSPEIAAILGMPEGSVRTRLMRARQILKGKLAAILKGKDGRPIR